MELLLIWCLFGLGAWMIASNKGGGGCLWFFLGMLLGPFGLIAAFFMSGSQCPHCRSRIHPQANVCPKCGREVRGGGGDDPPPGGKRSIGGIVVEE